MNRRKAHCLINACVWIANNIVKPLKFVRYYLIILLFINIAGKFASEF